MNKQKTKRLTLKTQKKDVRDTQHEYFICREDFNTLPDECTLST